MTNPLAEFHKARELLEEFPDQREDPDFTEALLTGETNVPEIGAKIIGRIDRAELRLQALDAEIAMLEAQKVRWTAYIESQKRLGLEALDILGQPNIRTMRGTLYKAAGSKSVQVFDETKIPAAFMTKPEPPDPKPDKTAIGKALKAGEAVPGAVLSNGPPSLAIKR